jgi:hypothetical protein
MADQPRAITKPCLLVVEGPDDKSFFYQLAQHLKIENSLEIIELGGKDKKRMAAKLEDFKTFSGFLDLISLGIVVDADSDPVGAFHDIQYALRKAKLPVPKAVGIPIDGEPRVSAYIVPGDNRPGMLEDLCFAAMPGTEIKSCIQQHFNCLVEKPRNESKAKFQMYIASKYYKDRNVRRLEEALLEDWPWTSKVFAGVKQFLLQVVGN